MQIIPRESTYPTDFRDSDCFILAEHIIRKRSVEIIGMKRVGISNFLRFYIYHPAVKKKYFTNPDKVLFIPVDLNNLIEREIAPFWLLTFKRLFDCAEKEINHVAVVNEISHLFEKSIQIKDLFLTIDSLRKSVNLLINLKITPVFFFIGFDRLKDVLTSDFFDNLQGLRDAVHKEVVYVFTSLRELDQVNNKAIGTNTKSTFLSTMYLKPADSKDVVYIFNTLEAKYAVKLDKKIKQEIIDLSAGHVQYLYLSVISLHDHLNKHKNFQDDPININNKDERILLQSEELYSSLTDDEQKILLKVLKKQNIISQEKIKSNYLWETGMVIETKKANKIFSFFLSYYLKQNIVHYGNGDGSYLTKKEYILFETLKLYSNAICERDTILEKVWPEYMESGVSDWAVDRLVARLRKKLELTNSKYKIKTIKTRGFMLEEK